MTIIDKAAFYGGIRDAILRHGNTIEFRDEFVLYLCRKPTSTVPDDQ